MKKYAMLLAVPMLLAGCGSSSPETRPYSITIQNIGYTVDTSGQITVPEVRTNLYSSAGAPDVREIKFVGTLLDGNGQPAAGLNSKIVPLQGNLFAGGKGGYFCTQTPAASCTPLSQDAVIADAGPANWPQQNSLARALIPSEWAKAHLSAKEQGNTAPWSVDIEFTAYQATGKVVTWKQNYQFVSPAN